MLGFFLKVIDELEIILTFRSISDRFQQGRHRTRSHVHVMQVKHMLTYAMRYCRARTTISNRAKVAGPVSPMLVPGVPVKVVFVCELGVARIARKL